MKRSRPLAQSACRVASTCRNAPAAPPASATSAGFAGHVPMQRPTAGRPGTVDAVKIKGSSPRTKAPNASQITIHAEPPGRAPGKARSSQVAPIAAAHPARIPTRYSSGTDEPASEVRMIRAVWPSRSVPTALEGRAYRQSSPASAYVTVLAARTAANAVGLDATPPVETMTTATQAPSPATAARARSDLRRGVPNPELRGSISASRASKSTSCLTAELIKGTAALPPRVAARSGSHNHDRLTSYESRRAELTRVGHATAPGRTRPWLHGLRHPVRRNHPVRDARRGRGGAPVAPPAAHPQGVAPPAGGCAPGGGRAARRGRRPRAA